MKDNKIKPAKTYVMEDIREIARRTNVYVPNEKDIENTIIVKLKKDLYEYVLEQPEGVAKYISKLIADDKKKTEQR